jgi:hypothetical protein
MLSVTGNNADWLAEREHPMGDSDTPVADTFENLNVEDLWSDFQSLIIELIFY